MAAAIEAAIKKDVAGTCAAAEPDGTTWRAKGHVFADAWATVKTAPGDAAASPVAAGSLLNGRFSPDAATGEVVLYALWTSVDYTP